MRTFSNAAREAMQRIIREGQQREEETELAFVRRVYSYNPHTGILSRRIRIGGASRPGSALGHESNKQKSYLRTFYKGRQIHVPRLIWFYQNGEWPPEQIDHINGNKMDNRWANLRLASNSQNKMNTFVRSDSTTGIKGVTIDRRSNRSSKPFRAHIAANGKRLWLGYFATIEEARQARLAVAPAMHGDFAKEGVS